MVTRVPSETHGDHGHEDRLRLTVAPWRVVGDEKILARSGQLNQYAYGSAVGPEAADEQMALILTPTSGVLVVDVDDAVFDDTALGAYLSDHQPISTRGALGGLPNRHYLVDMRAFYAQGRYVRQGPIIGGDVKSNGFVPAPGSVHPSGDRYAPTTTMGNVIPIIECDEELYGLLVAARTGAPRRTGADGAPMAGVGGSGELAATAHYLRHGLPGGAHDDVLTRLAMRLVVQGMADRAALGVLKAVIAATDLDARRGGWSDENLLRKVASARVVSGADPVTVPPGWAREVAQAVAVVEADQAGEVQDAPPTGAAAAQPDPAEPAAGEPDWTAPDALGSPNEPMVGARALEAGIHVGDEKLLVRRFWRGSFHRWSGSHWSELPDADVNAELYAITEHACYTSVSSKGETSMKPWAPTTPKITNLRNALAAVLNTSDLVEMPAWLDGRSAVGGGQPVRPVACSNVLVDPLTGAAQGHTAAYFNGHALDFAYDPEGRCPAWLGFLESVWPGDQGSRMLLAQWFGYVLSGRTDLQKLMYLKGLPRSGKGTIARILTALLGAANVVGPTFDSFGGGFGLELLVKAQLAVVGDARFTGDQKVMQSAISKILSITGEDKLNVDRKYKTAWSGTLPTRLMLLSNEMPWFRDSSSAIVDRMLLLIFKESFVGREDHTLELRLRAELPGIFNWALAGYRELVVADGRFIRPAASAEVLDEFRESVSPIEAWLGQECSRTDEVDVVPSGALYQRWAAWCEENGHKVGGVNGFLRLVQTVWPSVSRCPTLVRDANGNRVKAWSGIRYTGPEG